LGAIAILAVAMLRLDALLRERAGILEQRQAQATTLAQFAASFSARLYDQSARVASDVEAQLRARDLSDAELHAYLRMRASDTTVDDYIVVLDRSGRVRATSESDSPPPLDYGGSGFAQSWSRQEQDVVPVMRSRLTGAVIYSLSQRLQDASGAFSGVVGVNVRPEGIRPTAARRPQDPLLSVWAQDGRFIAASFVDFQPNGAAIAPPKPPGIGIPGSENRKAETALAASTPIQGWPLVAVASFDKRGVLSEWRRRVYETLAIILLVSAGIFGLVWLGLRTATREAEARRALEETNAVAAEALRQRDLLLKEIHHRVKNSLLVTSGLIYLQERRFNDPEVREAFESTRRRLNSIGLVHEALYSGASVEQVDLADYLPRLLHDLTDAYGAAARGIEIATELEPIPLPAEKATPVGLIVTEVVTNAFKHAFKDGGSGKITVKVRRDEQGDVAVEIRDDGQGFPAATEPSREGLGSRMIAALTEQLRGRAEQANDGGAVFRLAFPAA
jgi:two-component system, sensor histidine kinase PdtaS